MLSGTSAFIKNRNSFALTEKRVKEILVCVINSYEKIISDKIIFDYSKANSIPKEDFLRNRLVDDYLKQEISFYNKGTEYYSVVAKDGQEEYHSSIDNKNHNDKIDIQIFDKGLKNCIAIEDDVYFSIECKRINNSYSEYVNDILKFTTRNYRKLRIPYEGQLGFIESKVSYDNVCKKTNINLSKNNKIQTLRALELIRLKENYDGSYISQHKKFNNEKFSIFHLFLDYSNICID